MRLLEEMSSELELLRIMSGKDYTEYVFRMSSELLKEISINENVMRIGELQKKKHYKSRAEMRS